jgi:hypothetical protein
MHGVDVGQCRNTRDRHHGRCRNRGTRLRPSLDGSPELFQKYEMFVDTILNASEEILDVSPTKEWKASVRIQLLPHRHYLQSPHFLHSGYMDQYAAKFRTSVDEALSNHA